MGRRIIALLLVLAFSMGLLSGCNNSKRPSSIALSVGYGKVDVTPTESLPLGGYQGSNSSEFRWSTSVEWPFSAICVAITDANDNTVLLITLDMLNATMADGLRSSLSSITGVAKENIMVHVTHNHSGPALGEDEPVIANYITQMTNGVISAVKTALDNRLPVLKMETTYARPEGHNTERHYLLADGSYQSYSVGSVPKSQLIGHYGVADNLLQLVKFVRDGDKDVVFINWQGHPPGTDPNTIATANYPAVLCNYLNSNLNCDSIFFLGGSGNLNNNSQIAGDIIHNDYQELGLGLGKAAVEAAKNFTARNFSNVCIKEKMLQLQNRNYGANKVWVYAITVGDLALVTAPFEIFDDNAVAVRESSDYAMTMYLSCCNGSNGYLPTPPSFGWEITYESRTTNFPEGTAEIVQDELISLLKEVAAETGYKAVEKAADYYQAEFQPKTDGITYTNPTPGDLTQYKAVKNDFFAFQVINNGVLKNMLCNDEELVKKILMQTEIKFLFNEQSVVVGIAE